MVHWNRASSQTNSAQGDSLYRVLSTPLLSAPSSCYLWPWLCRSQCHKGEHRGFGIRHSWLWTILFSFMSLGFLLFKVELIPLILQPWEEDYPSPRTVLVNGPGHKRDAECSLNSCLFWWEWKFLLKGTLESPEPNTIPDGIGLLRAQGQQNFIQL